jgi:hypothetical protein
MHILSTGPAGMIGRQPTVRHFEMAWASRMLARPCSERGGVGSNPATPSTT